MQDDALLATETVRETLMFSACARLPSNVTIAEKIELVNETMRVRLSVDPMRITFLCYHHSDHTHPVCRRWI